MKFIKYLFLTLLLIMSSLPAIAANSAISHSMIVSGHEDNAVAKITISWLADDFDGSVPALTIRSDYIAFLNNWVCFFAVTDPGTVAPQTLYDIVVTDVYAMDIFGGSIINRSATLSEQSLPLIATGTYGPRIVDTALTVTITGNNVNSATGTLVLYFAKRWIR